MGRVLLFVGLAMVLHAPAWGQSVSGVRAMGGGVAPLFSLVGPGNLYLDNQGTQGYMYNVNTFESYNFRNPTTGQAWSGAVMTLGPQLSIGLIQGANQIGSPLVLIPPPPNVGNPLVSSFSLLGVSGGQGGVQPVGLFGPVASTPVIGVAPAGSAQPTNVQRALLLVPPPIHPYADPLHVESSLLEIP